MSLLKPLLAAFLCACLWMGSALAEDKPSRAQIEDLTRKAAELIAAQGLERAAQHFYEKGPFLFSYVDREGKSGDIYINVIDFNGVWLVYPPKPDAVGRSVFNVRDAQGRYLVQDIVAIARNQGQGWTEYRWMNPSTNRIEHKETFLVRVPGSDMIAYSGIYK